MSWETDRGPLPAGWRDLLFSPGPNPDREGKLDLFRPLIGAWDLTWTGYADDGATPTQTETGEWFFFWTLEGRMLQDLWIIPRSENRGKPGFPQGEYGTTLRYWDPGTQRWRASWFGPLNSSFPSFTIRRTDDEIILESDPGQPGPRKWIFSQITPQSFHWRAVKRIGDRWVLTEDMRVVRKPEASRPGAVERVWRGWTSPENAGAYEKLLRTEIFPAIAARNLPGYRGVRLLVRPCPGETEFMTVMTFGSLEDIRAFAGEDSEKAVVPDRARELLRRFDDRAAHYELREEP